MNKKEILKLIHEVNHKKPIGQIYPPLDYDDEGWRVTFGKSLEYQEYQKYSAGRKLLQAAIFDCDSAGGYYWIPYDFPPAGYTSPGLRLQMLQKVKA